MWLTRLAVGRPLVVLAAALALALLGGVGLARLRVDRLPPLNFPFVSVSVTIAGAGPEDVETRLLRPLEDALSGLSGVKTVTATAREGSGTVSLEFVEDTDVERALLDVERRVAAVRSSLPSEADAPRINRFDPNAAPLMNLALTGAPLDDLLPLARDVLAPQLQSVPGVADVQVLGGLEPAVQVRLDPARLVGYGIPVDAVLTALQRENVSSPAGTVPQGRATVGVRLYSRLRDAAEVGAVVVGNRSGAPIYLRNVATVEETVKEQTRLLRLDGQEAVGLSVFKQSDANTLEAAEGLRAALERLELTLPPGVQFAVTNDASRFVRRSLEAVGIDLGIAVVLTGLVLLLFLHAWRSTFIVLVSIPASLLCTFLAIWAAGLTLNLMTLMALAMTIGILVDDSIVVLENIHRHLADGVAPAEAAIAGRSEIGMAAIAITLTDVVVYLPVAFMYGNVGQLFRQYGLTVTAAALASLLVSFTLIPLLAAHWGRTAAEVEELPGPFGWLALHWETWLARWRRRYDRALVWALRHRARTVMMAVTALAAALALVPLRWVGTEYAPVEDDNQFTVTLSMAPDASLEATDATTRRLEAELAEIPGVLHVYSSVGGASASAASRSSATVFVELTERHTRTRTAAFIMGEVRAWGREVPEATVRTAGTATLGGGGGNVQVLIAGDDLATLSALADEVVLRAQITEGVANAASAAATSLQERRYVFDRERAAALGVNAAQAASALRAVVQGVTVSTIPTAGGSTMDITVRGPAGADPEALSGVPVGLGRAGLVRLGQVTAQQPDAAPVQITRTDRTRTVSVNIAVADRPLGDTVQDLQAGLDALPLPPGYRIEVRGAAQQLETALTALLGALALSGPLIYLLLTALFGSWLAPLAVLASLPVALAGAVLALWATENTINVFSMIGMVALMGLMAKNAILLVDAARDLQRRGLPLDEALRAAGQERLRPILMTTATVVLAMTPLALKLETGGESRAPMAIAVIGGSLSSTLLTLLLAPVLLSYLEQLRAAWLARRRPAAEAAAGSGVGAVAVVPRLSGLIERLPLAARLAEQGRKLAAPRPQPAVAPEVRQVRRLSRSGPPSGWLGVLWRVAHFFQAKPLAAFGALIILTLVFVAVFADFVAPYALGDINIREARLPPSPLHPLGTDGIGRDNLSKIIFGSRIAVLIGPVTVVLGTVFAVLIGLITGYRGGAVDLVFNRFMDAWMTFPDLIVIISAVAILGPDVSSVMIMIGVIYAVGAARVIRGAVVAVKHQPYIEAAQTLGAGPWRVMLMHVLPNIMGPVMVTASLGVGQALMMEAMVTYLGMGLPGSQPSWAGMIRANRLLALYPGLCIAATIFAFNVVADALLDYTGPRSRVFEPDEERELRLPRRRTAGAAAAESGAGGGAGA